jgi:N-acetylglucosaminyl-diphospho-decaprenol L-rhamnosyltransferase
MSNIISSNNPTHLLVVILNYRTAQLTIDCLQSLVAEVESLPGTNVVVTDNNSSDGSVEQISRAIVSEGWQDWASLMALDRNGGFAFGNNAAIRIALNSENPPDYILLLNPDTVARPQALRILLDFMVGHPNVGITGSRLENPDGTPQHSAFRFPTLFSELDFSWRFGFLSQLLSRWAVAPPLSLVSGTTDWVSGASMMVRREVFEDVGLLDENYFMYFEEVDFCLQAQKASWPCWYVPKSRVVHLVGQSSGVMAPNGPVKRLPQYWFNSRRRYFLKHHGWTYTALTDALWLLGFTLWRWRRPIQGKIDEDPPKFLRDFWAHSFFVKGWKI